MVKWELEEGVKVYVYCCYRHRRQLEQVNEDS